MRVVDPGFPFDTFLGHPVIRGGANGYMHFPNEQAVRDFMPTMTNTPPRSGYVAMLKGAFRRASGAALADYVEHADVERIVLVDTRDYSSLLLVVPSLRDRHVYLKSNLSLRGLHKYIPSDLEGQHLNLYPFPQFPTHRVQWEWLKKPLKPMPVDRRAYDVFFIGNFKNEPGRRRRREGLGELRRICAKWKLRSVIRGKRVSPRRYLQMMNDSLVCFSPAGRGYRCRREWEILLAGSVLWLDSIYLADEVLVPDFTADEHCVYCDPMEEKLLTLLQNRERIERLSQEGYDLALKCFASHPLDVGERYVRVYLLNPRANLQCYADLERRERELGLAL